MTAPVPASVNQARRLAGVLLLVTAVGFVVALLAGVQWLSTRPQAVGPVASASPSPRLGTPTPTATSRRSTPSPTRRVVPPSRSEVLQPVSAEATAERRSVKLACTGEPTSYDAEKLIDGDLDTGWGASSGDGSGQSITVTFRDPVQLTEVGLTPGFAKIGPREDKNCRRVSAFPHNRFVESVRYRFDDGTSVEQEFEERADLQMLPVNTITRRVRITILETSRPGADNDTIISEARFMGIEQ